MKRSHYSVELKAKVALQAIRGQKTVNQFATEYDIHPNQVGTWKKRALQSLLEVFSGSKVRSREYEQAEVDDLYQQIG
jgi:transposase-like protein